MHAPASQPSDEHLRYPLGRFQPFPSSTQSRRQDTQAIAELPRSLAEALAGLTDRELDTPYREGGWTLRQLAHHVADSHLNAYTRLCLALTEDWPTIKPYREALWAELVPARSLPVSTSLDLLAPLHARWVALLSSLEEGDWTRGYTHPESGRVSVAGMTQLYSWHGRHHTAHVVRLRERLGW